MRYLVILRDGTILCNVPEAERALNICRKYVGSYVVTSKWKQIYKNNGMHKGFLAECERYGWTLEDDAEQAEQYYRWLRSPVYGRR